MAEKQDFFGKDVTEAIATACAEFDVAQDQLEIDILEAGSAGIFGFAKKQAHIKAQVKPQEDAAQVASLAVDEIFAVVPVESDKKEPVKKDPARIADEEQKVSPEGVAIVRQELEKLLVLFGVPAQIEVDDSAAGVHIILHSEQEELLIGEDGKVLDSLQYLLRKITGRQSDEHLRVSLDVGNYRQMRLEKLKTRALELAGKVKADGKTQAIPALSPIERREIHLILQEDSAIRSRSVGDGMFKKILIYKPGSNQSSRKPGKSRRQPPRRKRGGNNRSEG